LFGCEGGFALILEAGGLCFILVSRGQLAGVVERLDGEACDKA
jgi:hypothetical protein